MCFISSWKLTNIPSQHKNKIQFEQSFNNMKLLRWLSFTQFNVLDCFKYNHICLIESAKLIDLNCNINWKRTKCFRMCFFYLNLSALCVRICLLKCARSGALAGCVDALRNPARLESSHIFSTVLLYVFPTEGNNHVMITNWMLCGLYPVFLPL